jgi:hypothetical protein
MRACGSIGFCLSVAVVLGIGHQGFQLNFSAKSVWELSHREIVIAVLALVLGTFGTVVGQAFGASIPIRSDNRARDIDFIWHFGANNTLIWNGVALPVFGLAMGKEAARAFRTTHAMPEMIWLGLVLPLLAGWAIAFMMWFSVEVLPKFGGAVAAMLMVNASPFVAAFVFGACEASELGLDPRWGLVMAITPLLLIPLSLDFMRKDAQRRTAS